MALVLTLVFESPSLAITFDEWKRKRVYAYWRGRGGQNSPRGFFKSWNKPNQSNVKYPKSTLMGLISIKYAYIGSGHDSWGSSSSNIVGQVCLPLVINYQRRYNRRHLHKSRNNYKTNGIFFTNNEIIETSQFPFTPNHNIDDDDHKNKAGGFNTHQ